MKIKQIYFIETNPLQPVGPAQDLFISGASIFEITNFEPPLQRVSVVGVNLPNPGIFGPFDSYVATLTIPVDGEEPQELASFVLEPTFNEQIWGGSTLLDFGGTLPEINAAVRPQLDGERVGPVILEGPVVEFEDGNGEDGNGENGDEDRNGEG